MTRKEGRGTAPFVLLDDRLTPGQSSLLFQNPVGILRCDHPEQAAKTLDDLAAALDRGLTAAGYLAYELGYLLEPKLAPLLPKERGLPLVWMGLFDEPRRLDGAAVGRFLAGAQSGGHELKNLRLSTSRAAYLDALARVKDYILAGDVYQINLTLKYLFEFAGDPISLYSELRRKQSVAHGAVIHGQDFDILSLSPELFVSVTCGQILAKPMKGTAARRPMPAQDAAQKSWLHGDEKSRAENLMIVDLLRNDVGRIAKIGSLHVPALFEIETYRSVHQMTSSITALLRPGVGVREMIQSLFPCGSVTGAPKVRAMEIIRELEPEARGVYTGAIGMLGPDGQVALNVAIRTLVLHAGGQGEMGIGSGIVTDSDPASEFDECLLKAKFLTEPFKPFHLIETLRWSPDDGYKLVELHMARLAASAAYFGYPCDLPEVDRALAELAGSFGGQDRRVRLTLSEDGELDITSQPLPPTAADTVLRYALSDRPIDRNSPFFYHKTTRREHFEVELERLNAATSCDEAIMINDRGELTEGTRTNLFIERGGVLLTPPLDCGLLDGRLRRSLLDDPKRGLQEAVLFESDLRNADAVYLGNSLRGLMRAVAAQT